jgi:hypothetical protein
MNLLVVSKRGESDGELSFYYSSRLFLRIIRSISAAAKESDPLNLVSKSQKKILTVDRLWTKHVNEALGKTHLMNVKESTIGHGIC